MLQQTDCCVCASVDSVSCQAFALLIVFAVCCRWFFMLGCVACSWVVITALSALVCTGAVLGFVFLRGLVPSPYDAITISNAGNGGYAGNNGGYAGNNGYHGYAPPFPASTLSLYWEQTDVRFTLPNFHALHPPPPFRLSCPSPTPTNIKKSKEKEKNVYAVRHGNRRSSFTQT